LSDNVNDCQFYHAGTCELVAEITGLEQEVCLIAPDACAACHKTGTPKTGEANNVIGSIAAQHGDKLGPEALARIDLAINTTGLHHLDAEGFVVDAQTGKRGPGAMQLFKNVGLATARWVKAGRPVRSEDEITEIFEKVCRPCKHFRPSGWNNRGSCDICGCRVNLGKGLNKLRWGTESCPDKPPRFLATHDAKGRRLSTEEQQQMSLDADQAKRHHRRMKRAERKAARAETPEQRERMLHEAAKHRRALEADGVPFADDPLPDPGEPGISDRERRKRERKIRKQHRWSPPLHVFPKNDDPLETTDRNKLPIGHSLRDLWRPNAGFLVCGGPSLKALDLSFLRERGIVSLGVNNVAGFAPVRAMTFSDPPEKFHHGIFFDPSVMKLVPVPKLTKRVRAKRDDGTFGFTSLRVQDCPNVWGYRRDAIWDAKTFLTSPNATWGNGAKGVQVNGREKILFTFFLGLRLLHYLGCRQVFMLGVDFSMTSSEGADNGGYAFNERRHEGAARGNNNSYRKANIMCHELRPFFDEAGFEVYNCNPASSLTAFDYVPLEQAKAIARGLVPPEPWPDDALTGWYAKTPDGKGEDDRGDD
jgi:hypothetical protein